MGMTASNDNCANRHGPGSFTRTLPLQSGHDLGRHSWTVDVPAGYNPLTVGCEWRKELVKATNLLTHKGPLSKPKTITRETTFQAPFVALRSMTLEISILHQ